VFWLSWLSPFQSENERLIHVWLSILYLGLSPAAMSMSLSFSLVKDLFRERVMTHLELGKLINECIAQLGASVEMKSRADRASPIVAWLS